MKKSVFIALNILFGFIFMPMLFFIFFALGSRGEKPYEPFIRGTSDMILSYVQTYWFVIPLFFIGIYLLNNSLYKTNHDSSSNLSPSGVQRSQLHNIRALLNYAFPAILLIYCSMVYLVINCSSFFCFFGSLWGIVILIIVSTTIAGLWPEKEPVKDQSSGDIGFSEDEESEDDSSEGISFEERLKTAKRRKRL
ncbi:MAG: hypothetical protein KKE20_05725 [Nanoarchaeota archaeon]|nr:hypothetical protein [Nanoarchaeota archaeon]